MKDSNPVIPSDEALAAVENEIAYLENALQGIKHSYAILSDLLKFHRERLVELTPDREEVAV